MISTKLAALFRTFEAMRHPPKGQRGGDVDPHRHRRTNPPIGRDEKYDIVAVRLWYSRNELDCVGLASIGSYG